MKVSEQEIDAYIRAKGIPVEKLADAKSALEALLNVKDEERGSYEISRKTGSNPIRQRSSRRQPKVKLRHSPEDIAKAFTTGWSDPQAWEPLAKDASDKPISTIIPELVRHPDTAWDVRGMTISSSDHFAKLMTLCRTPYVEAFRIAFLDSSRRVLHSQLLTIGSTNAAIVDPPAYGRELSRIASRCNASMVITTHNHPSGNPTPSSADISITDRLNRIFSQIGLSHLDHIITNGRRYFTLAKGEMRDIQDPEKPDWEIVSRDDLQMINGPDKMNLLVSALRQHQSDSTIVAILTQKYTLTALDIIDKSIVFGSQEFKRRLFDGVGYSGGRAILVSSTNPDYHLAFRELCSIKDFCKDANIDLLDFTAPMIWSAADNKLMDEKQSYRTASEIREAKLNKSWKVG